MDLGRQDLVSIGAGGSTGISNCSGSVIGSGPGRAYLALMDDRYPSTDEHQSVHLDYVYPDAERDLNRWLPLVKWFLAIPHFVVLVFLDIATIVVVLVAWFAILFTGRYPRGLFDFVQGVIRWHNRVLGYALVLVTDRYPPFRLS